MIKITISIKGYSWSELYGFAVDSLFKVDAVASAMGISTRTLQQHSKDSFGVSPKFWLKQMRAVHMRSLLASPENLPIKEVAYLLGYRSLSNMVKDCKKWHRATPQELRLRWRGDIIE